MSGNCTECGRTLALGGNNVYFGQDGAQILFKASAPTANEGKENDVCMITTGTADTRPIYKKINGVWVQQALY